MHVATTTGRTAAVLVAVSALVSLAGVAQAGTSSTPEDRALMLRSEALNQKYGLGPQRAAPQGENAGAYRALRLRSEALNQKHGLGERKAAVVTAHPAGSTQGFAWGAFGIGAVVTSGLALLAGGFFARHRLLTTRRALTGYRTT